MLYCTQLTYRIVIEYHNTFGKLLGLYREIYTILTDVAFIGIFPKDFPFVRFLSSSITLTSQKCLCKEPEYTILSVISDEMVYSLNEHFLLSGLNLKNRHLRDEDYIEMIWVKG